MQLIWFVLIGIAAGWLAGQIMKGSSFHTAMTMAAGSAVSLFPSKATLWLISPTCFRMNVTGLKLGS